MSGTATPVFDKAFDFLLVHEGEHLDLTRSDHGNWTGGAVGAGELRGSRYGISAASYPREDIANLTVAAAKTIYLRDFWAPVHGDAIDPAVALLVFDHAVNAGAGTAVRALQSLLGADQDGDLGPMTRSALTHMIGDVGVADICALLLMRRLFAYMADRQWTVDGRGWTRRLFTLANQATQMEAV